MSNQEVNPQSARPGRWMLVGAGSVALFVALVALIVGGSPRSDESADVAVGIGSLPSDSEPVMRSFPSQTTYTATSIATTSTTSTTTSTTSTTTSTTSTTTSTTSTTTPAVADTAPIASGPEADGYDNYKMVTDDADNIQVEIPLEWADIDGRPYTDDNGRLLYDVRAAADLDAFSDTWTEPGIIITASSELARVANEVTMLDEARDVFSQLCDYDGRSEYDDGLYTGFFDLFLDCEGTGTRYVVIGAVPESRAFVIRVQVQVVTDADFEALDRAIRTFEVIGAV